MKLLYKPFAIIASLIAARLGHSVFKQIWSQLDDEQPPKPTTHDAKVPKVIAAAALEAATLAGVAAVVDRAGARECEVPARFWAGRRARQAGRRRLGPGVARRDEPRAQPVAEPFRNRRL